MEAAGWQMAGATCDTTTMASYLDFLQDDMLGGGAPAMAAHMLLDSSTLAAAQAAGSAELRQQRKRPKRDPSHLDGALGDGSNDEDLDASDDDDELSGKCSKGGKRRASAAAQNKANREKARREKINDRCDLGGGVEDLRSCCGAALLPCCGATWCPAESLCTTFPDTCLCCTDRFGELAKMVDPSNEPKTDKLSILGEAIRFVQQTQLENSQLRQLNKFLEVRTCNSRVCSSCLVSR